MIDTRKWRGAVFLFFLLGLLSMLFLCRTAEKQRCLDVKILTEQEQAELGIYEHQDLSWGLLYNGHPAAVDLPSSTVYISQEITGKTTPENLLGHLETSSSSLQLSFAPDEAFENLAAAVSSGHVFKLNVKYEDQKYTQYDLVFTTLPVLRIEGEVIGKTEKGKDLCQGTLCLWTPLDPDTGRYSVKVSDTLWNVRGGWSASLDKTPFKVSLKDSAGENRNLSFVGLGADDDWILNPMNLDDTKLKEKLFSGLWNQRAAQVDWNEKMSRGEYVEVVINLEYWGLFQLQRRVDGKFLELDSEEVLLKGYGLQNIQTVPEAYEIVHSNLTEEETFALIQPYFAGTSGSILHLDNFLDTNLFLQLASAEDNIYFRNMFYLLRKGEEGYRLHLLPWDTDMSWGTVWNDEEGGFLYDFEASRQNVVLRQEYPWMQQYHPTLNQQMAHRWFQLREELLTVENMAAILQQEQQILDASGALKRDADYWGLAYQGKDSLENLHKSIEARLKWLDDYYNQYLQ